MIDVTVIARLIELGRTEPIDEAVIHNTFGDLRSCSRKVHDHWTVWRDLTKSMVADDLVALAKGLALAEQCFRWGAGSVSTVINVYDEIDSRGDYELTWNIAKWVVEHLDNPYAPFGHLPRRTLFKARLAQQQLDKKSIPKRGSLSADLSSEYEAIKERRTHARLQREQQEHTEQQSRSDLIP